MTMPTATPTILDKPYAGALHVTKANGRYHLTKQNICAILQEVNGWHVAGVPRRGKGLVS
jgi:hypothetical protein